MMALVVVLVVRMPSICNFHHSHRSIGIECFSLFDTVDYGKLISWIDYYFPCVWTMGMGFSYNLFISKSGSILGRPLCIFVIWSGCLSPCVLIIIDNLTTSSSQNLTPRRDYSQSIQTFPRLCWLSECNKGTACSSILPLSVADVALRVVSEIISTTYCLIINRGEECGFKGNFRFLCNLSYTGILYKLNV